MHDKFCACAYWLFASVSLRACADVIAVLPVGNRCNLSRHIFLHLCELPCLHFSACSLVPVFMPERLSSTGGFNYREGSIDKLKVEGEWQVKAVIARGWLRLRHQRLLDPENSFWQMHLLRSCRVAVGGWWHSLAQPTQTRLPAPHWANLKSILMPQALSCIMTCKKQKPSQYAWYQTASQ